MGPVERMVRLHSLFRDFNLFLRCITEHPEGLRKITILTILVRMLEILFCPPHRHVTGSVKQQRHLSFLFCCICNDADWNAYG